MLHGVLLFQSAVLLFMGTALNILAACQVFGAQGPVYGMIGGAMILAGMPGGLVVASLRQLQQRVRELERRLPPTARSLHHGNEACPTEDRF